MSPSVASPLSPLLLKLRPFMEFSDAQFLELCRANPDYRFERTANGEIEIMPPTGGESGGRNFEINTQLGIWMRSHPGGVGFDSSTGFRLSNGAIRSPDAAWVTRSRWQQLTPEERAGWVPLCPDFVLELRSQSDDLADLQSKMREWIDNGCRLGWLVDPAARKVYVYRPDHAVETLADPVRISGSPVLAGFSLDLTAVFPGHAS